MHCRREGYDKSATVLAIGVPSLLVLVNLGVVLIGFLVQSRNIDKRFGMQDKRFDRLELKVDRMDTTLHEIHLMLGRHDARLDALEKQK